VPVEVLTLSQGTCGTADHTQKSSVESETITSPPDDPTEMRSGETEYGQVAARCVNVAFTSPTVTVALRWLVLRFGSIAYETVPVP